MRIGQTRSDAELQNWANLGDALFADVAEQTGSADDTLGVLMAALLAMYKQAPTDEKRLVVATNLRTLVRVLDEIGSGLPLPPPSENT